MRAEAPTIPTEQGIRDILDMYAAGESHLEHWGRTSLAPILARVESQGEVTEEDLDEALQIRDEAEVQADILDAQSS